MSSNVFSGSYLAECRCETLNRLSPQGKIARTHFEDMVIGRVKNAIRTQVGTQRQGRFEFKLAVFASGHLFGEQVLLFRLLNELYKEGWKGTLHLSFIDAIYTHTALNHTNTTQAPQSSPPTSRAVSEFLQNVCDCLNQNVAVTGAFFASHTSYLRDSQAQHDLLIGADVEDTVDIIQQIQQKKPGSFGNPIVLLKSGSQPFMCFIPPQEDLSFSGDSRDCHNPLFGRMSDLAHSTQTPAQQTKIKEKSSSWSISDTLIVMAVAIFAIGGGAYAYNKSRNKRGK